MDRQRPPARRIVAGTGLVLATLALAGCDELNLPGAGQTQTAQAAGASPGVLRVEERDVERPDLFEMRSRALWDGRPSFGGQWIAVKRKVDSERVRLTNLDNGRQLEAAMYRTDENIPGPPIIVSSDAAEALGMTAGSPIEMKVVALRRETVEIPAPAPAVPPEADTAAETEAGAAGDGTAPEAGATVQPGAAAPTGELETTVLEALDQSGGQAAAPAGSTALSRPYIQVASGSSKPGADAAAKKLTDAGLTASVRTAGTEQNPVYRVVAGPFADRAAFDTALASIKGLGYSDAFAVR